MGMALYSPSAYAGFSSPGLLPRNRTLPGVLDAVAHLLMRGCGGCCRVAGRHRKALTEVITDRVALASRCDCAQGALKSSRPNEVEGRTNVIVAAVIHVGVAEVLLNHKTHNVTVGLALHLGISHAELESSSHDFNTLGNELVELGGVGLGVLQELELSVLRAKLLVLLGHLLAEVSQLGVPCVQRSLVSGLKLKVLGRPISHTLAKGGNSLRAGLSGFHRETVDGYHLGSHVTGHI